MYSKPYRILTIIGARPQFIKAAALSRAIQEHFSEVITEEILHTGQHYDENMSEVFFQELHIPQPHYQLQVGSGTHAMQTARMMEGIEKVLMEKEWDGVVLYGDTNSTLAGALAAAKCGVPVFHIEAGLRSFNHTMPEEINRLMCDHLSSLLFVPTQTGMDNLEKEGIVSDQNIHFANGKKRKVYRTGDIMYDNALYYGQTELSRVEGLPEEVHDRPYILTTIHRNTNTDDKARLEAIVEALLVLAEEQEVVWPVHPRTKNKINELLTEELRNRLLTHGHVHLLPPLSFLQMTALENHATMIVTDSGGVQKEAYFHRKPSLILRPETEWVEIVEQGAAMLCDADKERILEAYGVMKQRRLDFPPLFGDGHTAEFILRRMLEYWGD
ncbi:MAG: UDP-N-acetylglucosamine 2-epimerase (non-hydrolyzing) [Bacteroidetes bacterium]|uniref:UDP-N-acetylglucosamine 2-epimerase (Non-hydrolyzing) n=1 Tax=Candidatus Gallipaludibacter merdavium TaxID=2840839 RepID=A0A9D9HUR3_9BACT|nr:UDP-N-acetylglucosamine 2-epimerase (non-hydrolyzing) [Candidatus Gallipaludibacter merdavium]